jgi:uncharacterized damage-inducible protein DinB
MVGTLRLTPAGARALFAYNRAVFERYVRFVRKLPWREASRPRGLGHESLFQTLVHILNVEEVWIVYLVRGRNSDPELEPLFRDERRKPRNWREFDAYARRVRAGVEETLRSLSSRSLRRPAKAFWMPGRYTVADGLLQVSFEQAHHLGEVIGAVWQDDRQPPEMTWLGLKRALDRRADGRTRSRRRQ